MTRKEFMRAKLKYQDPEIRRLLWEIARLRQVAYASHRALVFAKGQQHSSVYSERALHMLAKEPAVRELRPK